MLVGACGIKTMKLSHQTNLVIRFLLCPKFPVAHGHFAASNLAKRIALCVLYAPKNSKIANKTFASNTALGHKARQRSRFSAGTPRWNPKISIRMEFGPGSLKCCNRKWLTHLSFFKKMLLCNPGRPLA